LQNGTCITGTLEVISFTGGLLCLPKPVNRGSRIKLMFLTDKGPVLGTAELLSPVSSTRQPFRFVALAYTDRRRLRAITQDCFKAEAPKQQVQSSRISAGERQWIEKYQAAVGKLALAAFILAIVGLSSVLYLLSLHFN
jgi:hypothetical protein